MDAVRRVNPLMRLGKSDWAFWSNDGDRLLRVRLVPAGRATGWRSAWETYRWVRGGVPGPVDRIEDWKNWEPCGPLCRTRAEAVRAALITGGRF